jgi:hypothetical protein
MIAVRHRALLIRRLEDREDSAVDASDCIRERVAEGVCAILCLIHRRAACSAGATAAAGSAFASAA